MSVFPTICSAFHFATIPDDAVLCCIGPRGSGKTAIMRDLLIAKPALKPVVFADEFSASHYTPTAVYDHFDPTIVADLLKSQWESKAAIRANAGALVILDTCFEDLSWMSNKFVRPLLVMNRSHAICTAITLRHLPGIPPVLRSGIDYVFIFYEPVVGARRRIYDQFGDIFGTFDEFSQLLDTVKGTHDCIVLHYSSRSERKEDCVFVYSPKN